MLGPAHIASDLDQLIWELIDGWANEAETVMRPRPPGARNRWDMDSMGLVRDARDLFLKHLDDSVRYRVCDSDDKEGMAEAANSARNYLDEACGWMLTGIARAKRRYGRWRPWQVADDLFGPIERASSRYLKYAEEGHKLVVGVDIKHLAGYVKCFNGYEWDKENF